MDSTQIVPTSTQMPATQNPNNPPTVTQDEKPSVIEQLQAEVLQYAKALFKEQVEDHQFVQAAQQYAIQNGFKDLDPSFVGMLTAATTNKNDLASKSLAPFIQLFTAAQQNELAERREKEKEKEKEHVPANTTINQLNTIAPMEVLQGFQALFNMANATQLKPAEKVENIEENTN